MTNIPIIGQPAEPVIEGVQVVFNQRGPRVMDSLQGNAAASEVTRDVVKGTPSLWNADLDDAYRYGGDLTRLALACCALRGDRRYTVVDTKVHMLMPGMLPAIPGWHTDGIPRDEHGDPGAKGDPRVDMLVEMDRRPDARPRYHLWIADTGSASMTEFITDPLPLVLPLQPGPDLYADLTRAVEAEVGLVRWPVPNMTTVEFDWLDVHRAVPALGHGWRFMMRVTETDWLAPQTELRSILRLHNPVYVPQEFGW